MSPRSDTSTGPLVRATIVALTIVLCCLTRWTHAGGKGKVPIYMPIPIPIPMPMGGHSGGPKYGPPPPPHHHHHSQHDDGEGEVKKIYLLQPMAKAQPQPNLKGGGFMGPPVQTHIHLQPPPHTNKYRQHSNQNKHQYQLPSTDHMASYEGDLSSYHGGGGGDHKQYSRGADLKILPIVVIPPIAPMPPIQMSGGNSHSPPRMTLTPQFNNYVVTSSPIERKRSTAGYINHQDRHTFSDYGGSLGGSLFRDHYSTGASRMKGRHSRSSFGQNQDLYGGNSWSRSSRVRDGKEFGDDLEGSAPVSWRSTDIRARRRLRGGYRPHGGSEPMRTNSIRDIVEQQTQFDDDPNDSMGNESQQSYRDNEMPVRQSVRHHQSVDFAPDNSMANSNSDMAKASGDSPDMVRLPSGRLRHQSQSQHPSDISIDELVELAKETRGGQQDLNSFYYDRDMQKPDQQQHQPSRLEQSGNRPMSSQRLPHLDEREPFDDEEWRFDTIKSVVHVDGNDNSTTATNTSYPIIDSVINNRSNVTSIIIDGSTTRPPKS